MIQVIRHGTVVQSDNSLRSYYGWPSVAKLKNGHIVVAASGHRMGHVCPWGRTTLWESVDQGQTFGPTLVAEDSPIDDRDAGVTPLWGDRMLLSWFTSDTRIYREQIATLPAPRGDLSLSMIRGWEDAMVSRHLGSFVMAGSIKDGWNTPVEIGVSAPHGPILQRDGVLVYLGKTYSQQDGMNRRFRGVDHPRPAKLRPSWPAAPILCCISVDGGRNWEAVGQVSDTGGFDNRQLHEPHLTQLPDGRLLGVIRTQWADTSRFHRPFSMASTLSGDGGKSWSPLAPMDVSGSPPHLLVHSSGVVILTYGYRAASEGGPDVGSGQRVLLSKDGGQHWSDPLILRDDGPDGDLGYPATCELEDGSLLTVYYQKSRAEENCSILSTHWNLV